MLRIVTGALHFSYLSCFMFFSDLFQFYLCFYNSEYSFLLRDLSNWFLLFLSCFAALLRFDDGPPFTLQRLCEVSR